MTKEISILTEISKIFNENLLKVILNYSLDCSMLDLCLLEKLESILWYDYILKFDRNNPDVRCLVYIAYRCPVEIIKWIIKTFTFTKENLIDTKFFEIINFKGHTEIIKYVFDKFDM